jgi:hypothetical protein
MGISNGFTSTLLGALWPEVYSLANLGGIRAIAVSAMVLSSALEPGITGALLDLGISADPDDLHGRMVPAGVTGADDCREQSEKAGQHNGIVGRESVHRPSARKKCI